MKKNEIDYFAELVKFDEKYGAGTYAESFCIVDDEEDFFETWLNDVSEKKAKEYSDAMEVFASADGTGACYAFWFTNGNIDKNKAPIIYYGSEGDISIVAENIKDLIKMLSFGAECMNGSFYHSIDDEEDFYEEFIEYMPNHLTFREWMKNSLNIKPVSLDELINDDEGYSKEVDKLQTKAEKKIKKVFDEWQYQYYKGKDELKKEYKENAEKHQQAYDKDKAEILKEITIKPTAELYFKLAENEKNLNEINNEQQKEFLEKALVLDENHKDSLTALEECLLELADVYYSNPEKSVKFYNQLIQISENPEEYYGDIAGSYKKLGNYEQSLAYYVKSILADDGYGAYQRYVIDLCEELKDKDGLKVLEETLQKKPNAYTYEVLYREYFKKGKYTKALENVLKYIEYDKLSNFIAIGKNFFKKELYKEALAIFEKVSNEKTTNYWTIVKALKNIGLCHLRIKPLNIDKALEVFKEAYKLDKDEVSIHNNINLCGTICIDKKEYDKAIAIFEYCISNNIMKDIALNNIGACYFQQKEYKQALVYFEKAHNENPDNEMYKKSVVHIQKLLEGSEK